MSELLKIGAVVGALAVGAKALSGGEGGGSAGADTTQTGESFGRVGTEQFNQIMGQSPATGKVDEVRQRLIGTVHNLGNGGAQKIIDAEYTPNVANSRSPWRIKTKQIAESSGSLIGGKWTRDTGSTQWTRLTKQPAQQVASKIGDIVRRSGNHLRLR